MDQKIMHSFGSTDPVFKILAELIPKGKQGMFRYRTNADKYGSAAIAYVDFGMTDYDFHNIEFACLIDELDEKTFKMKVNPLKTCVHPYSLYFPDFGWIRQPSKSKLETDINKILLKDLVFEHKDGRIMKVERLALEHVEKKSGWDLDYYWHHETPEDDYHKLLFFTPSPTFDDYATHQKFTYDYAINKFLDIFLEYDSIEGRIQFVMTHILIRRILRMKISPIGDSDQELIKSVVGLKHLPGVDHDQSISKMPYLKQFIPEFLKLLKFCVNHQLESPESVEMRKGQPGKFLRVKSLTLS